MRRLRGPLALLLLLVSAGVALTAARPSSEPGCRSAARHLVEIRSYNLRPGSRAEFHRVATEQALPMLRRHRIDVVAAGPSPHDTTSYYLIRAFASLDARQQSEDRFYGSTEWRDGPRAAILALIESYTTVVLEVDDRTLAGLRH